MKECAAEKGIEHNAGQGEGVEAVCSDEVVGAFLFDILHALAKTINRNDEINEIGHRIDRLADQFIHVGVLAEEVIYIALCIKPPPDHMAIKDGIENGDKRGEYDRGDYGEQYPLPVCLPKQMPEKDHLPPKPKSPCHNIGLTYFP